MSEVQEGVRALVTALGDDPLEVVERHLALEPQAPPDPGALAPGDAVVAVRSAAVGWVDLLMMTGVYQHAASPPYTPGLEYAGVVVAAGAEVDPARVAVGDAVLADGLQTGPRSLGAHRREGGFASFALAPASALLPLPRGLDFDQAASLLSSYETAYHCLIARGRLQPGETVLVHGASGSTGLAAVHLAKLVGATVIATGRSPDKLAIVQAQGADHVLCTAEGAAPGPRFRDAVKGLTGGAGVDVVYDGVGGETSLESLRCVRFGARFLVVGWAATPLVARSGEGANVLPTNLVLMKGLDVLGCPTAIATHRDPTLRAARLADLLGWVEAGRLRPFVGARYALADVKQALRAKWTSAVVGGCVVHPAPR